MIENQIAELEQNVASFERALFWRLSGSTRHIVIAALFGGWAVLCASSRSAMVAATPDVCAIDPVGSRKPSSLAEKNGWTCCV